MDKWVLTLLKSLLKQAYIFYDIINLSNVQRLPAMITVINKDHNMMYYG